MIIATLSSPITLLYCGGWTAPFLIALSASPAIALFITGEKSNDKLNEGDYASTIIATATVGLYFLLLGAFMGYYRLESYFDSLPWAPKEGGRNTLCPFTGRQFLNRAIMFSNLIFFIKTYKLCMQGAFQQDDARAVLPRFTRMHLGRQTSILGYQEEHASYDGISSKTL